MKLCTACTYHVDNHGAHDCHAPELGLSPVTGLPRKSICEVQRAADMGSTCGPGAQWFAPAVLELPRDYVVFPPEWDDPEPQPFNKAMREVKRG